MDPAYYTWLIFAAVGLFLGRFVHPRMILKAGAALFVLDAAGLAVGAATSSGTAMFAFGVGAIAIPILTGVTALGAYAIRAISGHRGAK
jgi:hypothetical protein